MGAIDTLKDVAFLVQKVDNIELVKRTLELQQQVQDLFNENRDLKEQVRELQERLTTREALAHRGNAYWKSEHGPFCTCCFDTTGLLVRLNVRKGYHPQCPNCKNSAHDPDAPPPRPFGSRSGRSSYLDPDREPRF